MAWNGDRAGSCRLPVDEPDGVAGPVAVEGIESVPTGIGPFAWIQDGQGVLQERNASCWRVQISAKEDGCFCGGGCDLFLDEAVDDDYRIGFVLGVCWNRNAGLYSRLCFFRACCSRLGVDDVFYVDFRRFHFACARNYW